MVPSKDREGRPEEACLYGTEYYLLEDAVVGVLMGEVDSFSRYQQSHERLHIPAIGDAVGVDIGVNEHAVGVRLGKRRRVN